LLLPAMVSYAEKTSAPSTFFNEFTTLNDNSTSRTQGSDICAGTTTAPGSPVTLVPAVLEQGSILVSSSLDKSDTPQAPSNTCQSHHNNIPSPDACEPDKGNAEPRSPESHNITYPAAPQQSGILPLDFHSRYAQVLHIMTPMFGSILSVAKIILIIQTGDKLIRDDAITFLRDQLPLWKGMWHQSGLLVPSWHDSITDQFVKVSRCINILQERSIMDRIRILFHRVLQYQYYLHTLKEIKQKKMKSRPGVGHATYALDHLLEHLYINDWDQVGHVERKKRRDLFHKAKHLGKRLLTLSGCVGFGILLLGSPESMGRMQVAFFPNVALLANRLIVTIPSSRMICLKHWYAMLSMPLPK
jgi:hypothetical protein